MIQYLEDFFRELRNHGDISQTIVTLSTAVGSLWILASVSLFTFSLIKGTYLYGYSKLFKLDLRKRYGQWAVITGVTDGIGLGFAKELALRGHSLILIGRNQQKLDNVKSELSNISKSSDEIMTVKIDFAHATLTDFERMSSEISPENREIGILINCAGVFPSEIKRYLRHGPEDIRQMVSINVDGTIMATRYIMPSLAERQSGLVINVASGYGVFTAPYLNVYCATKAFICSFSDSLRMEYSKHNVDVINLTTGPVYTKLMTSWTDNFSSSLSRIMVPLPQDYARSVLAMAGRTSGNTSGYFPHELMIRGGYFLEALGLRKVVFSAQISDGARNNKLSPVPSRRKQKSS